MSRVKDKNKVTVIFIIIILALCFIIYLLPKATDTMKKTITAEYGTVDAFDNTQCYIFRNETVYAAGYSGKTEYLLDEGEKIRKGTKILNISEGSGSKKNEDEYADIKERLGASLKATSECRAPRNGVVSYYIDGYESMFSPKKLKKITYDQVKDVKSEPIDLKRKKVLSGEPIYKMYKNEKWYIVIWVNEKAAKNYKKGNETRIYFKNGEVSATVASVVQQENRWRVTMSCNMYYEHVATIRTEEVKVVTNSSSGIIVENRCIYEEDGKKGVKVRNTAGEYVFKPVKVLMKGEKESVLQAVQYYDEDGKIVETVDLYDEVLRNP